jgi:hypothetical protein
MKQSLRKYSDTLNHLKLLPEKPLVLTHKENYEKSYMFLCNNRSHHSKL